MILINFPCCCQVLMISEISCDCQDSIIAGTGIQFSDCPGNCPNYSSASQGSHTDPRRPIRSWPGDQLTNERAASEKCSE